MAPNGQGCARPEVPPCPRQPPPSRPAHARPSVSGSQGLPTGEATPPPTPNAVPLPPHPRSEFTDPPHSTYRLRTSSGSEMAREASVGTRAGAVRAGILETAAETAAAEAALAFRAETNGEGRRVEAGRTISARAWGKVGHTIGIEAIPCAGRWSGAGCAQGPRMRETGAHPHMEQWARPNSAVCWEPRLRGSFIHSS